MSYEMALSVRFVLSYLLTYLLTYLMTTINDNVTYGKLFSLLNIVYC